MQTETKRQDWRTTCMTRKGHPKAAPPLFHAFVGLFLFAIVADYVFDKLALWMGVMSNMMADVITLLGTGVGILGFWVCYIRRRGKLVKRLSEHSFKLCLRCGYTLEGLQAQHTCPECAAKYDIDDVQREWEKWTKRTKYIR